MNQLHLVLPLVVEVLVEQGLGGLNRISSGTLSLMPISHRPLHRVLLGRFLSKNSSE
jgi:hypothetical protein